MAHIELLGRGLDQQLSPAPPLDERIKAIVLLRNCGLNQEQRQHLALKRAGTQPFQTVADLLRTLDRPEAFLQASAGTPAAKRAYAVALDEAPEGRVGGSTSADSWRRPYHRDGDSELPATSELGGLRALVAEIVSEMLPSAGPVAGTSEEAEELGSNDDYDSEGQLKVDFESQAEYPEVETLQILAYHTGTAQVRRDLLKDKSNRGFRPPPRNQDPRSRLPRDRNPQELLARTRCWSCDRLGHVSRDCTAIVASSGSAQNTSKTGRQGFFRLRPYSKNASRGPPALKYKSYQKKHSRATLAQANLGSSTLRADTTFAFG